MPASVSAAVSVTVVAGAEDSSLSFAPCGVYLWLESRPEITSDSYRMDSALAPDRRSRAAEAKHVDSSSVLIHNDVHRDRVKPPSQAELPVSK